jgi:hypothetical protein
MVPQARKPPSLTVFFPCYNEQENVTKVAQQALEVLEGLHADYEVIIINDGGDDTGLSRIRSPCGIPERPSITRNPGGRAPVRLSRRQHDWSSYRRR